MKYLLDSLLAWLTNLDIVQILSAGAAGLAFLFAALAFALLFVGRQEQAAILKWFMGFCIVLFGLAIGGKYLDQSWELNSNVQKLTDAQTELTTLRKDKINYPVSLS